MRPQLVLLVGLGALLVACEHSASLDRARVGGTRTDVDIRDVPVRGFDARVYLQGDRTVDGELLDVQKDFVAIESDGVGYRIPVDTIDRVKVTAYSNAALVGGLSGWSATGLGTSLSHGWFIIFSGPVWLAVGVSTAVVAATDPDQSAVVKAGYQTNIWQFVRFPQGLPAGYRLEALPSEK